MFCKRARIFARLYPRADSGTIQVIRLYDRILSSACGKCSMQLRKSNSCVRTSLRTHHGLSLDSLLRIWNYWPQAKTCDSILGGARLYGDFSAAGLAGRIAQGLTVLFMERRGYVYLERLESLIARSQGRIDRPNPTAQIIGVRGWPIPAKTPDFIFEKRDLTQSRALAVSGGVKVA